jgi:hypothetical protein
MSKSFVTPITAALFIISAFTGILLLFHLGGGTAKKIHEWLSIGFAVVTIVHLVLNWRIFASYLNKPVMIGLGVAVLVVLATTFGGSEKAGGGSPVGQVFGMIERAPLTNFAPLVGVEAEEAMEILKREGLTVSSENQTIGDIAKSNGRRTPDILAMFRATGTGAGHEGAATK